MAKKPPAKRTPTPATTGRPAGLFTWIAVGLVVVVVAALVIIKVATGSSSTGATAYQATSATVVSEVSKVPASVFNTVGVKSPAVPISPPIPVKGQPALTGSSGTATLPEVFYLGAEYCPFCAPEIKYLLPIDTKGIEPFCWEVMPGMYLDVSYFWKSANSVLDGFWRV